MLKSMSINNFIHFRDRQVLKFEAGANFIIGANSTGKTACFELIRRCFSNKVNKTTSFVPNKRELAYTVCHFKISKDDLNDVDDVIAGVFVKEVKNLSENDCIMYKVLCTIARESTTFAYVKKFRGRFGCLTNDLEETSNYRIELEKDFSPVRNILDRPENNIDDYETPLFAKLQSQETTLTTDSISKHMGEIYTLLENRYVGVMPMRSIGPTQWTRSKHYQSDENYKIACTQAEILNELLTSDKTDQNLENTYDGNLIFPFEFKKGENEIYVENETTARLPLLKCPEGIVEAKQLILILSNTEFSTITFEEPDRGMHPHMIKKMRDLILREVVGKTVLIITHSPTMINQWSMSRSFVCTKQRKQDTVSHNIRKVPEEVSKKYGRNEEMKCLLFSPRVFFVEGKTDKIVFEAIFNFLTTNLKSPFVANTVENKVLKDYLLATEVIELESETHGDAKIDLSNKLMKETLVLYDFDHYKKAANTPNKKNVYAGKKSTTFSKDYDDINDFLKSDFYEFEKVCEHFNEFCWKGGDLEDQILHIRGHLPHQVSENIVGKSDFVKNMKKHIKKKIPLASSTDIDIVAEAIVEHLPDMERFIRFLKRKSKVDTPTSGEKRKAMNETDTVQEVPKRKKSDDQGDQMSTEILYQRD